MFGHHLQVAMILITIAAGSYLEMPLVRTPSKSQSYEFSPIKCSNESNINLDAQYKEICFQKDITYSIPFIKDGLHYSLSADFTTPLSWVKGKKCFVEGTNEDCHRLTETFIEKIKQSKSSVKYRSRLHKMAAPQPLQNAIIEGSSQIIRGEFEKERSISLIVKDSNRLNNFFELILLGLFIYGERDNLTLVNTNFINAMYISPNLNALSDGAISLRFDSTAQSSFLQEIFTYVEAIEKTVTVYLGNTNSITIGDLTAKFTKFGYSGIQWIDMPSDQGFGKLPEIVNIGIGDISDDREDDTAQNNIPAVFTLSASYISFSEDVINKGLIKNLANQAVCKINANNFVECSSTSKKKLQKLLQKNLVIGFKGTNAIIPMNKLVLKVDQGRRAIFNIKKSYNNKSILGEPVFQQYVLAFDYVKNRIGFAQKRQENNQFLFQIVALVRFLCCVMLLGCSFFCCFEPCQNICKRVKKYRQSIKNPQKYQSKSGRQYQPIFEGGRSQQNVQHSQQNELEEI